MDVAPPEKNPQKAAAGRLGAAARAQRAAERKLQADAPAPVLDTAEKVGRELEEVIHAVKTGRMDRRTGDTLVKALHARLRVVDLAVGDRLDQLESAQKAGGTVVPGGIVRRQGRGR
jgi:phosphoglycolate phosphatase-like HAD superfamily hydrolase